MPPKSGAACQAFLMCDNRATTTIENPIVGTVRCCERCKQRLESKEKKCDHTRKDGATD